MELEHQAFIGDPTGTDYADNWRKYWERAVDEERRRQAELAAEPTSP